MDLDFLQEHVNRVAPMAPIYKTSNVFLVPRIAPAAKALPIAINAQTLLLS
jgi:hypothetical protein